MRLETCWWEWCNKLARRPNESQIWHTSGTPDRLHSSQDRSFRLIGSQSTFGFQRPADSALSTQSANSRHTECCEKAVHHWLLAYRQSFE